MAAVAKQDISTLRFLLTSRPPSLRSQLANFRFYNDRRPLHVACAEGLPAIARELLRAGADPGMTDSLGVSCVREAIRHGRVETLRVLGEFCTGFPGRIQPTDVDPKYALGRDLMAVVVEGNVNAAKQIVRHFGASVNFANADGRTPLHIAVVRRDLAMVSYLLEAGADVQRKDRWGVSPMDEAVKGEFHEVAELMGRIDRFGAMWPSELAGIVNEAAAFAVC